MQLSKFSDYALRVLIYAAAQAPRQVSLDELAGTYGVSRNHLVKVVQRLGQLGHVATRRGRGGGITLGRAAEEIALGSLVRETESTLALVECLHAPTNTCPLSPACRLKGLLAEAQDAFFDSLDRFTVADLVRTPEKIREVLTEAS